jgi:arsenical pump membrane protein
LLSTVLVWAIAAAAIGAILFRLKEWPEAVWACLGAALLVVFRLIPPTQALHAVFKGTDVYLFLTGMMLTADLARREGVFDWLASIAVAHARGSGARLFSLIFSVGILVTVFLSNDATAVVLTPAVYAAVKKARTNALPHLLPARLSQMRQASCYPFRILPTWSSTEARCLRLLPGCGCLFFLLCFPSPQRIWF